MTPDMSCCNIPSSFPFELCSDKKLLTHGLFRAVAGVVSRTSTAPLDRIKVYLIAHTEPSKTSLAAAKKGDAVGAIKHIGQPLLAATKELWKAGGMRSLFAGGCFIQFLETMTNHGRQWVERYEGYA